MLALSIKNAVVYRVVILVRVDNCYYLPHSNAIFLLLFKYLQNNTMERDQT